jgi:hypothetical protein
MTYCVLPAAHSVFPNALTTWRITKTATQFSTIASIPEVYTGTLLGFSSDCEIQFPLLPHIIIPESPPGKIQN